MRLAIATLAGLLLAVSPAAASTLRGGSTDLTFDNAFGLRVAQLGINPAVVAPATQDSLTFTLPVVSGTSTAKRARIRHAGGLELDDPADDATIRLTDFVVTVRGRRATMSGFATLGGTPPDALIFASGRARSVRRSARAVVARDIRFSLNGVGAAALNSQFTTTVFAEGDFIGTGTVRARRQKS